MFPKFKKGNKVPKKEKPGKPIAGKKTKTFRYVVYVYFM